MATTAGFSQFRDVRGRASGGELWALVQPPPFPAGQEVKIVWRITGFGELKLRARHPDGTQFQPRFLQPHLGSNWRRPGDEWGSGFTFPKPGCWQVHAERGSVSGDVWFLVA